MINDITIILLDISYKFISVIFLTKHYVSDIFIFYI